MREPVEVGVPIYLTRLVGRAAEVDAVGRYLVDARLVTVVGAGGGGKTRLAAEVAPRSEGRFAEDVVVAALAAVPNVEEAASVIATESRIEATLGRSMLEALVERF